MQLFGIPNSPFVRHCRIVLQQSGIACDFVETSTTKATSPTKRVPYLQDGDLHLTDSASIVRYLREKAGEAFLPEIRDYDRFCLVNTAADTCVNLFVLSRDGVTPETSAYMKRQRDRVESILQLFDQEQGELRLNNDADLRLMCYLDWALFRDLINIDRHKQLTAWLERARQQPEFVATAPVATAPRA